MHYPFEEIIKLAEIDPKDATFGLIIKILRINNIDCGTDSLYFDHFELDNRYPITIIPKKDESTFWKNYKIMINLNDLNHLIQILKKTYKLNLFL